MHGMNYQAKRVNYPERREEALRLWPQGPFSNSGNDFPKIWRVREKKQPWRSEGGTMRGWGGEVIYVYVSLLTFFPPLPLPPDQIQG